MNFLKGRKLWEKISKWKKSDWLILILVGILLMVIAIPTSDSEHKNRLKEQDVVPEDAKETDSDVGEEDSQKEYRLALEQELSGLLSKMDGVGKVEVMITLENSGQKQLDKNVESSDNSYSSETVIYENDDREAPYIVDSCMPNVAGVVVVAQGGENPVVASRILDAVQSLFGLEAHKITIVKMSALEDAN